MPCENVSKTINSPLRSNICEMIKQIVCSWITYFRDWVVFYSMLDILLNVTMLIRWYIFIWFHLLLFWMTCMHFYTGFGDFTLKKYCKVTTAPNLMDFTLYDRGKITLSSHSQSNTESAIFTEILNFKSAFWR